MSGQRRGGLMSETPTRMTGEVDFHFEKGNAFRVIHVDGVIGAITSSSGSLHMTVYSERLPLPQRVVHTVADGVLGPELVEKRISRSGLFREMEADLVLSVATAVSLRAWLDDRIHEFAAMGFPIPEMANAGENR